MDILTQIERQKYPKIKKNILGVRFTGLVFGIANILSMFLAIYYFTINMQVQGFIYTALFFMTLIYLGIYAILEDIYINRLEIVASKVELWNKIHHEGFNGWAERNMRKENGNKKNSKKEK